MNTPLQKLPFDEALYQTFSFINTLEKSISNSPQWSQTDKAAVKQTVKILAALLLEHAGELPQ